MTTNKFDTATHSYGRGVVLGEEDLPAPARCLGELLPHWIESDRRWFCWVLNLAEHIWKQLLFSLK